MLRRAAMVLAGAVCLTAPAGASPRARPSTALEPYARGLAAKANGDFTAARAAFLDALRADSTSAAVLVALLEVEAAAGHDSALVAEADRYRSAVGPDRIGALLLTAGAEARLGRPERAEAALVAAVAAAPDSAPLHVLLGQARIERGDTTGALAAFRDAVARAPADPELWHVLGSALAAMDSLDAAAAALTRSLELGDPSMSLEARLDRALVAQRAGRFADALADYAIVAEAAPEDPSIIAHRSECLAALGRIDEAARELERLRTVTGSPAIAERRLTLLYWRAERPSLAARHARALAKLVPNDPLPHEVLGYLALDRGKTAEAEREFELALARDSAAADLHFALGAILTRERRAADAVPHLRRAVAGNLGSAGPLYFLGLALTSVGDTAAAIDTLMEAHRRDPRNGGPPYLLGQIAHARGDLAGAAEWMRVVLAADSSNASAWNYIGYMQADAGVNLQEALGQIRHALSLDPDNGAFLDSYGWVLFKLGRLEEARVALERAARKEPRESEILEHLGDVYTRLGRTRDARRAYAQALAVDPRRTGVARKMNALGSGKTQPETGPADAGNRP